ncbi:hypothetical protein [Cryobacterium soli]|uniref:hypothetical protein n=1 Tax=Cryobacterium soli TaxID=2220095 RepID=UPI0013C4F208|nr:hypothetical protein [Cryobacterium soli]
MTPPPPKVRAATYKRDGHRCVTCGTSERLEWQHRAASGHGGRGKKAPPLTPADGVTSCWVCNPSYEGAGQPRALALGWKIRRFTQMTASQIPFFVSALGEWWLPDELGGREIISHNLAQELLAGAGSIEPGGVLW